MWSRPEPTRYVEQVEPTWYVEQVELLPHLCVACGAVLVENAHNEVVWLSLLQLKHEGGGVGGGEVVPHAQGRHHLGQHCALLQQSQTSQ